MEDSMKSLTQMQLKTQRENEGEEIYEDMYILQDLRKTWILRLWEYCESQEKQIIRTPHLGNFK